jgi:hypothetical protein
VEYVGIPPVLVYNASFETWEADGAIASWNLAEGFEDKWEPVKAKKVAAAPQSGSSAIELPAPAKDQTVVLSQTLMPGKIVTKRRLQLSAKVNTTEKEAVHLVLTYKAGDKTETVRRVAQGTGTWETLETQFWVPENADLGSFRLQIIVQRGAKASCQLDDVRVQHMAPKGSPEVAAAHEAAKKAAAEEAAKAAANASADTTKKAPEADEKSDKAEAKPEAKSEAKPDAKAEKGKSTSKKADSKSTAKPADKKN